MNYNVILSTNEKYIYMYIIYLMTEAIKNSSLATITNEAIIGDSIGQFLRNIKRKKYDEEI